MAGIVKLQDASVNTQDSLTVQVISISSQWYQIKIWYFRGNDGGSAITALTLDMSAAGAATFNNDVTAFSDARLKDNVETIPNALETVCAMRGVNFTRNDNNDQPGTGVIAQEMQEVFPVVVKENNDEDNTLSVSYGNLVGVLIESIKELSDKVDTLQDEIQTLKGSYKYNNKKRKITWLTILKEYVHRVLEHHLRLYIRYLLVLVRLH